jgi:acyl-CoA thioesterase FadM
MYSSSVAVEREPSSVMVIRPRDCDALGHLHNTRYGDYFMDAREDHLRHFYGFNLVDTVLDRGVGWYVVETQMRHFAAARVGQQVTVVTRLFDFDRKSLHVEGRMYGPFGDLLALIWWRFRHVDVRSGRTIEHDDEFMRFCDSVVARLPEPAGFDARTRTVERKA